MEVKEEPFDEYDEPRIEEEEAEFEVDAHHADEFPEFEDSSEELQSAASLIKLDVGIEDDITLNEQEDTVTVRTLLNQV